MMTSNFIALESEGDDVDPGDTVHVHPSRRANKKIVIGILSVLLVLAIAIGLTVTFAVLYGIKSDSSSSESDVCQSEACFQLSMQIVGTMDETADPCQHFYNFTCGNWDIYNNITKGK